MRNIAVYLVAVAGVLALNTANNVLAQARAEGLVSAVKAYHSKYQCYPQSLSQLSPEFIEHIPLAKYTLVFNFFWYAGARDGQAPLLFYVAVPPFGRVTYSFGRNEWGYLD